MNIAEALRANIARLSRKIDYEIKEISTLTAEHTLTAIEYRADCMALYKLTGEET
jgi:hypothetical protein